MEKNKKLIATIGGLNGKEIGELVRAVEKKFLGPGGPPEASAGVPAFPDPPPLTAADVKLQED